MQNPTRTFTLGIAHAHPTYKMLQKITGGTQSHTVGKLMVCLVVDNAHIELEHWSRGVGVRDSARVCSLYRIAVTVLYLHAPPTSSSENFLLQTHVTNNTPSKHEDKKH